MDPNNCHIEVVRVRSVVMTSNENAGTITRSASRFGQRDESHGPSTWAVSWQFDLEGQCYAVIQAAEKRVGAQREAKEPDPGP